MKPEIYGKNSKPEGIVPAIILTNPKFSANVGAAVRAASCFGAKQVWWTGDRVKMPGKGERLPREERIKDGWIWPAGFAEHYVKKHRVKPTDEFLKFIGYEQSD